jgi:hypothetical protein
MRLKKYLKEKYLATFSGRGDIGFRIGEQYREIYVNPTPMEMKNLVKTSGVKRFRFIVAPKEQKLIVWPIRAEIHLDMIRWLAKKGYMKPVVLYPPEGEPREYVTGFITSDNSGKMEITAPGEGHFWSEYSFELSPEWLKKYISNYNSWIEDVKRDYYHYGSENDAEAAGLNIGE